MNTDHNPEHAIRCVAKRWLTIVALPIVVHLMAVAPAEPIFGGDSNRHVMTSVFFRDFLLDGQFADPKGYAEAYFEQYPALGLLVWPPLFHGVCGLLMIFFGTSVLVARLLIVASMILAAYSVRQLARRAVDDDRAMLVTIVFCLLPLVFSFSRDVMLEMPTLGLVLYAVDRFDRWLRFQRAIHLYIAAAASAMAALTRFDAVVLLPCFLAMLFFQGQWKLLWSGHTVAAVLAALLAVSPVYALIVREMGELHLRQAAESVGGSVNGSQTGFLLFSNLVFYPSVLVEQSGWPVTLCFLFGLSMLRRRELRKDYSAFTSLLLATYLTFTPLAELRSRHAIYWLPAVAFFAVNAAAAGCSLISQCGKHSAGLRHHGTLPIRMLVPLTRVVLYAGILSTTALSALKEQPFRVNGYRQAAEYVLQHTTAGQKVFFDGWWDGNFTYQMRHLDTSRSRHIVRGDRLLYDFVCIPATDFRQHAQSDRDMLRLLLEADPVFVVIENPQFYEHIPVAQQLRNLIRNNPSLFQRQEIIPVDSSLDYLPAFQLEIYRFDTDSVRRHLQSDPL